MAAGILLGPSLLGLLAPESFIFVFPPDSLGTLKLLSQIGVCLSMFTVGMELELGQLGGKAQTAVVVSHAGIVIHYFLGVVLANFLYESLAQPGASFKAFALFMGISMSITAFPVLARILEGARAIQEVSRLHRQTPAPRWTMSRLGASSPSSSPLRTPPASRHPPSTSPWSWSSSR